MSERVLPPRWGASHRCCTPPRKGAGPTTLLHIAQKGRTLRCCFAATITPNRPSECTIVPTCALPKDSPRTRRRANRILRGHEVAGGAGDLPSPAGSGPHCLQPDDGPVSGHLDGDVVNEMACHPQPSTGQLVRCRGLGHRHGRPGTPVLDLEDQLVPVVPGPQNPAPEPCTTPLAATSWTASTTSAACSRSTPVNIRRTAARTWDNWSTVNSSRPSSRPPAGAARHGR